jgi:hypothetical protein
MRARATVAALAVLAVTALAGCGSGSSNVPPFGVGPNVGAPISLADCIDWKRASVEERLGTIRQLKNFAGGEVVGGEGTTPAVGTGAVLEDKKAYELLDHACDVPFAQGFKLYKLYERAAAFSGTPADEPTQ